MHERWAPRVFPRRDGTAGRGEAGVDRTPKRPGGDLLKTLGEAAHDPVLQCEHIAHRAVDLDALPRRACLDVHKTRRDTQLLTDALKPAGDDPRRAELSGPRSGCRVT